jgi:hypothetical protein
MVPITVDDGMPNWGRNRFRLRTYCGPRKRTYQKPRPYFDLNHCRALSYLVGATGWACNRCAVSAVSRVLEMEKAKRSCRSARTSDLLLVRPPRLNRERSKRPHFLPFCVSSNRQQPPETVGFGTILGTTDLAHCSTSGAYSSSRAWKRGWEPCQ